MFQTPQSRWRALQTRNPLAASVFVYAVKTTGIYCRPTCPSRLARQANVTFFDSATDAECAGFRPCRRCKPSQSDFEPKRAEHNKAVRKACELMDAAGGRLTLEDLASDVGLSPRYFHGIFKSLMGVTPGDYARSVRKQKAIRASLGSGECEEATPSRRDEGRETMSSGEPVVALTPSCYCMHLT
jgi:methylphosphotriester-DNA--protein-cysteine methyltransferase